MIDRQGRVEVLTGLIKRSHKGGYFEERLTQYLCDLTLETLAYRDRVTPEVIKEQLHSDLLDIPHEILVYLRVGLKRDAFLFNKGKKIFLESDEQGSAPDLDHERLVIFLENQLG